MAQRLAHRLAALASLLRQLAARELRSFSSVGFNNLTFCALFVLSAQGGKARDAFWSTLLFQLVLLGPMLVMFSLATIQRLPGPRVAAWPLSGKERLLLGVVSFCFNPIFVVLTVVVSAWMGAAIACAFLALALVVHLTVMAVERFGARLRPDSLPRLPILPTRLGGVASAFLQELFGMLDLWAAVLLSACASAYRLGARSAQPEAFPILSILVALTLSTLAQRLFSLDQGRARLRLRLLPVSPWKLLLTHDLVFLLVNAGLTASLHLGAGLAFALVAIAIGRYPSLCQSDFERRGRFCKGDPRFGAGQIVLGTAFALGVARTGAAALVGVLVLYVASVIAGHWLWKSRRSFP